MEHTIYLAYGSNLNLSQMALRCPGAKALGAGELPGWRLAFRGAARGYYLTLLPQPDGSVPVGVWEVTPGDLDKLDKYEGYPEFYYRATLPITYRENLSGRKASVEALVYIMREDYPGCGPGSPTEEYYQCCLEGFRSFGLDVEPLKRAYLEVKNGIC